MLAQEYRGLPLTWQRIAPGNTVTTIAAGVYQYKEYTIGYDSGDYAFVEGDVITGATSGAMGVVRSVTVDSGTVAGGDAAGKIRFHSWNGINFTNNEKIKVAADGDVGDIDGTAPTECTDNYLYRDLIASSVLVCAETNTQRLAFSGRKILTDQTAKVGITLAANSMIQLSDMAAIKNLNVVDATAGSAGATIIVGLF
jgi:hypothetical protein